MKQTSARQLWAPAALLVLGLAVKWVCAALWDPLADEALYWTWSQSLAAGYYDQPPLIAWMLAATTSLGQSSLSLRLGPLVCGLAALAVLTPHARRPGLWWMWMTLLPPLWWLTLFATPDAPLLLGWAVGLAGAIRGDRRGWLIAGLAAGWAFQAKHTGALLFPLLFLGAGLPWRAALPGGLVATGLALPNLVWNAQHGWVTLRFQAAEGWTGGSYGALGPVVQVVEQLLVCTPVLGLVGYIWVGHTALELWRGRAGHIERLAWWTSAPLLVLFFVSALGGTPEAHWTAPAWLSVGLGLSQRGERWARACWTGGGLGLALTGVLVVHSFQPILGFPKDPAMRLTEGRALSDQVAKWALPVGVAQGEQGAEDGLQVWTERYQEAALVQWHTGLSAQVWHGCGRPGQHLLVPSARPRPTALFLRPSTSGPPTCIHSGYSSISSPRPITPRDPAGRAVGPWQLFELEGPTP